MSSERITLSQRFLFVLHISLLSFLFPFLVAADDSRPNIILMMADDMGYGELRCYNPKSKSSTPNLDSLAQQGVRFTDFYAAAPICTPSRRALLSGRYPTALGAYAEAYRMGPGLIASREPSLGTYLDEAGYVTAVFGKWSVGDEPGLSTPEAHGFDEAITIEHSSSYFTHQRDRGIRELFHNGKPLLRQGEYLTDIFADGAIDWIKQHKDKPFFVYLPWAIPHSPLQGPDDKDLADDDPKTKARPENRSQTVKMVEYLDKRVGDILATLKELGLEDKTLIIFTSDNGGQPASDNTPLRDFKQSLFEGGIRVPLVIQWPGFIPAGSICRQPSIHMDLTATVIDAAKAEKFVPKDRPLDGVDLLPYILGEKSDPNRVLGWRRRQVSWKGNYLTREALRQGPWKYIREYKFLGKQKWGPEYQEYLFNLQNDLSEKNNLAAQDPQQLAAMSQAFERWKEATLPKDPYYLAPMPDQLGKPSQAQIEALTPTMVNQIGNSYLPNPHPETGILSAFDFDKGQVDGNFLGEGKSPDVAEFAPVPESGTLKGTTKAGGFSKRALLWREGGLPGGPYKTAVLRMKVSPEEGKEPGKIRSLLGLRTQGWKGTSLPIKVIADGQWQEYSFDLTKLPEMTQWTRAGRVLIQLPQSKQADLEVEVDYLELRP